MNVKNEKTAGDASMPVMGEVRQCSTRDAVFVLWRVERLVGDELVRLVDALAALAAKDSANDKALAATTIERDALIDDVCRLEARVSGLERLLREAGTKNRELATQVAPPDAPGSFIAKFDARR